MRRYPISFLTILLVLSCFSCGPHQQISRQGYIQLKTASFSGNIGDIIASSGHNTVLLGNITEFSPASIDFNKIIKDSAQHHPSDSTELEKSRTTVFRMDAVKAIKFFRDLLPTPNVSKESIKGQIEVTIPDLRIDEVPIEEFNKIFNMGIPRSLYDAISTYKKAFVIVGAIKANTLRLKFDSKHTNYQRELFEGKTTYTSEDNIRITLKYLPEGIVEIKSDSSFTIAIKTATLEGSFTLPNTINVIGMIQTVITPTVVAIPGPGKVHPRSISLVRCRCSSCPTDCKCCPRQ
jgi:hypothetical protein